MIITRDKKPIYDIEAKYVSGTIIDIGSGDNSFSKYVSKKVHNLDKKTGYTAPDRLPFKDKSVDYIHCSHLVEHLYPHELYELMRQMDRVLKVGGYIAIATPLMWKNFYGDLTHIKPYNPDVFIKYFCKPLINMTNEPISDKYRVVELVWRYSTIFKKNGYLLILQKYE